MVDRQWKPIVPLFVIRIPAVACLRMLVNLPPLIAPLRHDRMNRLGALLLLPACLLAPSRALADKSANWRAFRAGDGFVDSGASAISMSPRGTLLVKHTDAAEISAYDGYTVRRLPSPGRTGFRVYESRSGQLWSLFFEGLTVFDGTQWIQHSIPEIRAENSVDPILRQIRQISLIPAERDRVLFLVSDRLMEYDVSTMRPIVIRSVADTGLGKFFEMTEARDGSIWIAGARGLAHLPGPVRRVTLTTAWTEFLIPESTPIENLQRPFEDARGGITALAMSKSSPGKRVIVHFDGTNWTHHLITGETLRQAWAGWDESTWACSINSLFHFDHRQGGRLSREDPWAGQFKDVLTETNNVFWLATSEGLVRYAPYLWRTPDEVDDFKSLVHATLQDASGRLWFATVKGLLRFDQGRWTVIRWPENFEAGFTATDCMYALPSGSIAIGAGDEILLHHPVNGRFSSLTHPDSRRVRLVGQFKSGELCIRTSAPDGDGSSLRIESCEGTSFQVWPSEPTMWSALRDITAMFTTSNGDVWFGGIGGTALVRNGQLQLFTSGPGFRDEQPASFLELADGTLWCGGTTRIQSFNGRKWSTVQSNLERVSSLARTGDGKIWAATAQGLFAFSGGSWMHHGLDEGLPSPSITRLVEDRDGRLWAGTTRGLSLFHPEADDSPPRTMPPVLPNEPTEGTATVVWRGIDKWHNTPVERLLFSYRMDEAPWSAFTEINSRTFENLGTGRHRFKVRAMDRNWNEDPNPQSIEFSVLLPWYREPRLVLVSVAGIALVIFFAGLAVNQHLRLIRSYAEVGKIVAIRTRELERANEELLHSQKMKALGTLAAGIAHDFNNILSIIKGSAQIIERHPDDALKIRTRVERIKTVVEQGSGIVKSMLGLSRATEKDLVPCELAPIVSETVRLLGDRYQSDVTFRFEAAESLPPVPAIKELLQQMLYNLVLNAVDAMSGGGTVILRAQVLDRLPESLVLNPRSASSYVRLSIEDSGSGIPPEIFSRIFEPFFTTKALSSRRGTGLGLSMVYELAKEMGYGLHVQSVPGQGTTFSILMSVAGPGPQTEAQTPQEG